MKDISEALDILNREYWNHDIQTRYNARRDATGEATVTISRADLKTLRALVSNALDKARRETWHTNFAGELDAWTARDLAHYLGSLERTCEDLYRLSKKLDAAR